jgi:hypothetical protein
MPHPGAPRMQPGSKVWILDPESIFAMVTVVAVGVDRVTVTKSPEDEDNDQAFDVHREVGLSSTPRVCRPPPEGRVVPDGTVALGGPLERAMRHSRSRNVGSDLAAREKQARSGL